MTTKSVAQYLEFANLQIAAEAFYGKIDKAPDWKTGGNITFYDIIEIADLQEGNNHTSKFSEVLATEFKDKWKTVAHISNTGTGFSGTLFEAHEDIPGTDIKKGDLTLSFLSTEFIEDAVRDNRATNKFEINDKGFAFLARLPIWSAGWRCSKRRVCCRKASRSTSPVTASVRIWQRFSMYCTRMKV